MSKINHDDILESVKYFLSQEKNNVIHKIAREYSSGREFNNKTVQKFSTFIKCTLYAIKAPLKLNNLVKLYCNPKKYNTYEFRKELINCDELWDFIKRSNSDDITNVLSLFMNSTDTKIELFEKGKIFDLNGISLLKNSLNDSTTRDNVKKILLESIKLNIDYYELSKIILDLQANPTLQEFVNQKRESLKELITFAENEAECNNTKRKKIINMAIESIELRNSNSKTDDFADYIIDFYEKVTGIKCNNPTSLFTNIKIQSNNGSMLRLDKFTFSKFKFVNCSFKNVSFENTSINDTTFENCTFEKVDFSKTTMSRATANNLMPELENTPVLYKQQICLPLEEVKDFINLEQPNNPNIVSRNSDPYLLPTYNDSPSQSLNSDTTSLSGDIFHECTSLS